MGAKKRDLSPHSLPSQMLMQFRKCSTEVQKFHPTNQFHFDAAQLICFLEFPLCALFLFHVSEVGVEILTNFQCITIGLLYRDHTLFFHFITEVYEWRLETVSFVFFFF